MDTTTAAEQKQKLAESMKTQEEKGMQQLQELYKSAGVNGSSVISVLNGISNGIITEEKIENIMQKGFDDFKKENGRGMTYSEMREMYG
jgi:hypothetical protein